jgi:hypothetical protein
MSEKLYQLRPGQKPSKLQFSDDDLPILQEWYEATFPGPVKPAFSELDLTWKNMFAKSVSFALYRCRYRYRELGAVMIIMVKKSVAKMISMLNKMAAILMIIPGVVIVPILCLVDFYAFILADNWKFLHNGYLQFILNELNLKNKIHPKIKNFFR